MIGLYIHIPFCERKCLYCDFTSYTGRLADANSYFDQVLAEAQRYRGEVCSTIFIGGGTPSVLPDGAIASLVRRLSEIFDCSSVQEFSIEANPNSFTREKAREYASIGINRISFGLQATQPHLLKRIGRLHTKEDFTQVVAFALDAGIANINSDIMYSLPGQSLCDVEETCQFLLQHPLTHVSAYALKLEEGTPLFCEQPVLPDEDTDRAMFGKIKSTLEAAGYSRYEISNFAKPGFACQHNMRYWTIKDYIGLGCSAHSCYQNRRFWNAQTLDAYLSGGVSVGEESVDSLKEALMLGLRLTEGVEKSILPDTKPIRDFVATLCRAGLATLDTRLRLSDRGLDIQNEIVSELFIRI